MSTRIFAKMIGAALLPALLASCSGSQSSDSNGNAVYLAEDPQVMASNSESGDTVALEIYDVEGAVVEVK